MKIHPPTATMKITIKFERIQPTVMGLDDKGELVWEAREMSLWQRIMFPLQYMGDFMAFWVKRRFFDATGYEPQEPIPNMDLRTSQADSKSSRARRKLYRNTGD